MRPGLLVVGVALIALGAVVTYNGFTIPGSSISHGLNVTLSAPNIEPAHERLSVISFTNASSATFAFSWTASGPLNVSLYQGVRCQSVSGFCMSGPALADWPANTSGGWRYSGTVVSPYLLAMQNGGAANVTLGGSIAESYSEGTTPAPDSSVLPVVTGGVLLAVIGGIAVFLGLFLRSGVYSRPEAVAPRYAHEFDPPRDGSVDPLDEPFDETDGVPDETPGGPPAH